MEDKIEETRLEELRRMAQDATVELTSEQEAELTALETEEVVDPTIGETEEVV